MQRELQFAALAALAFLRSCNASRSWCPALGGLMACFTAILVFAALLEEFPASANSPLLFLKIFISICLIACFVVLVLRVFGRLLLDLIGISDGRSPRSNNRYA
jgi:Na+/H+ antiporter NhaD/arsenite permease-like protein